MEGQRKIPFGYCIRQGKIEVHDAEAYAVRSIFGMYNEGSSYSKIAEAMSQIIYYHHTSLWNKGMIMRIICDSRYIGDKNYPPLISDKEFQTAQRIRVKNARPPTSKISRFIRNKCRCYCGGKMIRDTRNGYVRWVCADCGNRVSIEDENFIENLSTLLLLLAQKPDELQWPKEVKQKSLDLARFKNEVTHAFNQAETDLDYLRSMVLAYAAEAYANLPDLTTQHNFQLLSDQLKIDPTSRENLESLFHQAVLYIEFDSHGVIALKLYNGKHFISKE